MVSDKVQVCVGMALGYHARFELIAESVCLNSAAVLLSSVNMLYRNNYNFISH